jgi:choline monooxygenase
MSIFEVNPDIRRAQTLSSEFYTDEKYFAAAREKIFARTWQLAGTTDEASNLKPFNILETPLILSKNGEKVSCFSNVCTHRGAILVEKDCLANGIRCRYHGRRFDLQGKFLSMPEFENVENFPSEKDNLRQVPSGVWGKFIFASLDPTSAFENVFGEMKTRLNWLDLQNLQFAPELSKEYLVKSHWALYCENYLEGFHIPFVHPALNNVLDYGSYTTELFRYSSLQLGLAKEGEVSFDLPDTALDFGQPVAAFYFFVFPNLMFNFYPWGLSLNVIEPINCSNTRVKFLTYILDESKFSNADETLHQTELEDEAVVESVQRGIRSRLYDSGRYSPAREQGTHHFHRLICEFMK